MCAKRNTLPCASFEDQLEQQIQIVGFIDTEATRVRYAGSVGAPAGTIWAS